MIQVGIVGASGYTGAELLRLLTAHIEVSVTVVTSRTEQGRRVGDVFPSLHGGVELTYAAPDDARLADCALVFFATPNAVAMTRVPELLRDGVRVIDLSADFRLRDAGLWRQWYGQPHACPELLATAVYGLPELNREAIRNAGLVANPGCYPTAIQLGFLPLLEQKLVDPGTLIADAKSGVSGAGRGAALKTRFCEAADALAAYAVAGHRHHPEIMQNLAAVEPAANLVFVPHLAPMNRGIHATLYARLRDASVDLQAVFEARYASEPFVQVMPPDSHPSTSSVRGSNMCRLACHQVNDGDTAVILAVEDNLVKGAAGQAVQNMNLMFGFDETLGLTAPALFP